MQTEPRFIYYFGGYHLSVYKYKIIKETEKTYMLERGYYNFRLNKKEIDRLSWDKKLYSFDKEKVVQLAWDCANNDHKKLNEKIEELAKQIKEL